MPTTENMRKVTVSLPPELLAFADDRARVLHTNRSHVISMALTAVKKSEEARLAAEGYRFYAQESLEFAEASHQAVTEAWQDAVVAIADGADRNDG